MTKADINQCAICQGVGFVPAPGNAGLYTHCQCTTAASERIRFAQAGVPAAYISIADSPVAAYEKTIRAWCEMISARQPKAHEIIWCSSQRPEVRLLPAAALCMSVIRAGLRGAVRYADDGIKAIFDDKTDPLAERWARDVQTVDFLAVVVNEESASKFLPQVLADVLDRREPRPCRTMFVTTDDPRAKFARYGARMARAIDRLVRDNPSRILSTLLGARTPRPAKVSAL